MKGIDLPGELPRAVHHVVDARNWDAIQRTGLRTAASLAGASLPPPQAAALLRRRRPAPHALPCGAVLRDQRPMPESALRSCLTEGLETADWYELVNEHVFFWVDRRRLERHLTAQSGPQIVLEVDGPALAAAYRDRAFLTAFNVGAAVRRPAPRGRGSFVGYEAWRSQGWASEMPRPATMRRRSHPPAELAIRGDVPDILAFVSRTFAPELQS